MKDKGHEITTERETSVNVMVLSLCLKCDFFFNNYCNRDQCINDINVFMSNNILRVIITMCIINSQTLYIIVGFFFSACL